MTHTAKEPDPSLNAVQGDEAVEVLVFKMAVALGFDAPRAFTLVSFRTTRDPDFGVQIVGRLMRVDRRLQGRIDLPQALDYGYVFLSDREGQSGMLAAGDRINSIKAELASLATHVDVAIAQDGSAGLFSVEAGQTALFPSAIPGGKDEAIQPKKAETVLQERRLWDEWGLAGVYERPRDDAPRAPVPAASGPRAESGARRYQLKAGPAWPTRLARAEIDVLDRDVLGEVLDRFRWDDSVFTLAMTESQTILMEEREIFSGIVDAPTEIRARLMREELGRRAQYSLVSADRDGFLDRRRLYEGLVARLKAEADRRGLAGFDSRDLLETALARVLALRPGLLSDAVDESFARHTVARDAADLPSALESDAALDGSRLNLYGVFPPDLNTWERPFAELVDNDLGGIVRWWHRNSVRKPWSVALPIPGHGFFYPDLVIGVEGRSNRDSAILVEVKHQINDPEGNAAAKSRAQHPDYGPVLMLYLDASRNSWMTVTYDRSGCKNVLDRVFRLELLRSW